MPNNPLDLPLRDIHLPDPIAWWPLAYGWWLLIGFSLLCILSIILIVRYFLKPTLQKQAAFALDMIEKSYQQTQNASVCITDLSKLLRRIVISQNKEAKLAGLTGEEWLKMLDMNLEKPEFSQGAGQLLLIGPYHYRVDHEEVSQLLQLCRKWVKRL